MNNQIQSEVLSELATAANAANDNCQRVAEVMLDHAHDAGDALAKAKSLLPHGSFESWCATNVRFSARTARQYLRIAANWTAITEHRVANPKLTISDAIELLTVHRDPEAKTAMTAVLDDESSEDRQSRLAESEAIIGEHIGRLDYGLLDAEVPLPNAGEIVVGIVGDDVVVIEADPKHLGYMRIACLVGSELCCFRRSVIASAVHLAAKYAGIHPRACEWFAPVPAVAENNPLAELLDWQYVETAVA